MGGNEGGGKAVEIPLLPFHKAPVHPARLVQRVKLFGGEVFQQPLQLGQRGGLRPGVLGRDAPHNFPLGQHGVPQCVHTVGRGILGLILGLGSKAVGIRAVLGLRPILGQIIVDAGDGFFVIARRFQALHIVRQAHVEAAEAFVVVFHVVSPLDCVFCIIPSLFARTFRLRPASPRPRCLCRCRCRGRRSRILSPYRARRRLPAPFGAPGPAG